MALSEIVAEQKTRTWLVLTLVCTAQFVLVLDLQTVALALPTIQQSLNLSQSTLQWIVSLYELVLGGGLLLAGRAADFIGAKRLFMGGLGLFATGAFLCSVAPTGSWLITARGVQGLGAALLLPVALTLLLMTFPDGPARSRALVIWGAAAPFGGFVGVRLGGYLVSTFGWSWVFFVNVPVALFALVCAPWVLPPSPKQKSERLDLPGAILGTGGLLGLVYGLSQVSSAGLGAPQTFVPLGAGTVLLIGFYFAEQRTPRPLVPFSFFRRRSLLGANILTLVIAAVTNTPLFFLTLYFQQVEGISAFQTGLAFLPTNFAIVGGSALGAWLSEKYGSKHSLVVGLALLLGAMLTLSRLSVGGHYVLTVLPGVLLLGLGLGIASVAANIVGTSGVQVAEQGLASGLLNTAARVGTALGLALLVALSSSRTGATQASGEVAANVLVEGFRYAFYGGAGLAAVGLLFALFALREPLDAVQH